MFKSSPTITFPDCSFQRKAQPSGDKIVVYWIHLLQQVLYLQDRPSFYILFDQLRGDSQNTCHLTVSKKDLQSLALLTRHFQDTKNISAKSEPV